MYLQCFTSENLSSLFKANSRVWEREPRAAEVNASCELFHSNVMQQYWWLEQNPPLLFSLAAYEEDAKMSSLLLPSIHFLCNVGSTASSVKGSCRAELGYASIQTLHQIPTASHCMSSTSQQQNQAQDFSQGYTSRNTTNVKLSVLISVLQSACHVLWAQLFPSWQSSVWLYFWRQYFNLIACNSFHFSIIFLHLLWLFCIFALCPTDVVNH